MKNRIDERNGLAGFLIRRMANGKSVSNRVIRASGLAILFMFASGSVFAAAPQFSAWSAPVNMGPSINTAYNEWHAAISADGLTIFFSTDRPGGFGAYDLWVAQRSRANESWGPAQNLGPTVNTFAGEFTPELSPDGHWLFFSSSGFANGDKFNIYAVFRSDTSDNFGWGAPVNLGKCVNFNHPTGDPSLFIDPLTGAITLLLAKLGRAGQDDWNIYQSVQGADGTFGAAVLIPQLNTPARETHPTVRRDGLEVLFTSDRPGSLGGVDVWVSTRQTTTDNWFTPVNLGSTVNTEFNDRAPYLSDDGLSLLLISDRPGGLGGNDLYLSARKRVP